MILHGTKSKKSFPEISIVVTMLHLNVVSELHCISIHSDTSNGISMHVRDH